MDSPPASADRQRAREGCGRARNDEGQASEVLAWKPGDTIFLDQYVDDPIKVTIEKALRFKARPGVYRSARAVRIDERVFPDLTDVKRGDEDEEL